MAKRSLGTESTPTFIDNPKTWAFIASGFEEIFINFYPPLTEILRTFFWEKKGEAPFLLKRESSCQSSSPTIFSRDIHDFSFFGGSIALQDV